MSNITLSKFNGLSFSETRVPYIEDVERVVFPSTPLHKGVLYLGDVVIYGGDNLGIVYGIQETSRLGRSTKVDTLTIISVHSLIHSNFTKFVEVTVPKEDVTIAKREDFIIEVELINYHVALLMSKVFKLQSL